MPEPMRQREPKEYPDTKSLAPCLEEVIDRCVLLEEGIVGSIESWADVTPEGDVKTQIGQIGELTFQVDSLTKVVNSLSVELQETKSKSQEEIQRLKTEKRNKEKELEELRQEISMKTIDFGLPISASIGTAPWPSSSITFSPFSSYGTLAFPTKTCASCGKEYQSQSFEDYLSVNQCPACRAKDSPK